MLPSIAELQILIAASRTGSVSAAARDQGVSQQTASSRLRALERRLGLELLLRSPQGVSLTSAGDAVVIWAKEVLESMDRFAAGVESLTGDGDPTLRVGGSQTIAGHRLPGWLLQLRSARLATGASPPEIAVRTGNSEEIIDLVRSGEIELGFVETPDIPADLGRVVVQRDRMVIAVHPEHPWARRTSVDLREVARTPLVSREPGSGTRAAFEAAVGRREGADIVVAPALVLSTEAGVRSAAAEGVAPAVLSELTIGDDVRLGRLRAVPIEPEVHRAFTAVWRGGARDLTGPQRSLVAIASQALERKG